jgi:zinc transport system substrate-binding protein
MLASDPMVEVLSQAGRPGFDRRGRRMWRRCIVLLAAAFALAAAGCEQRSQDNGPIKVAVSIPPLADMARQIGGERVTVVLLVPPGSSVHTYEPTPRQVRFVADAHILVLNGINLEFWAAKVIEAANNPELQVVHTAEGIPLLEEAHGHHDHGEAGNPHVWLDPVHAMRQAGQIRDALIAVDPEHQSVYLANAHRYLAELQALDGEIQAEVATWRHRRFVAFHSAWVYFAERYGLEQVAVIEEFPGKEASPEYLAGVVGTIRRLNVPAVLAEPQLPARAAEAVANEAGVAVVVVDPLGGVPGVETYVELLRYNVAQMATVLK